MIDFHIKHLLQFEEEELRILARYYGLSDKGTHYEVAKRIADYEEKVRQKLIKELK